MRRHITFVLGALLLLGLAGCAGSGGDTSGGSDREAKKEAGLKFAKCMRENGVPNYPDPDFDDDGDLSLSLPPGVDPKSVEEPQEKCQKYLPNGGAPEKPNPEDLGKIQAFAKCMRENGVPKFPDPDSEGRLRMDGDSSIDPNSAEFTAANEKCAELMPGGGK
jgi:hypothetical protein